MSDIIKICKIHKIEQIKKKSTGLFYCKKCASEYSQQRYHVTKDKLKIERAIFLDKTPENEIVKRCKLHGDLRKHEITYITYQNMRCRACDRDSSKRSRINNPETSKYYQRKRRLDNLEEFRKRDNEYKKKDYKERKDVYQERSKKFYQNNKDKVRNYRLKKEYGITLEQYNKIFEEQKGLCKICGSAESAISSYTKEIKFLAVDHNHTTKEVRSLLCSRCNCLVGYSLEDTDILKKAIEYLKGYQNGSEKF
jgi:ribosomal protein L37AE/L43A